MLKPIELYPNFFCFVGVIIISSTLCWVLPLRGLFETTLTQNTAFAPVICTISVCGEHGLITLV